MSHPEQETLLDLAPAYALGALSPEESRRFEEFLAASPEARREVAEFREVAALLALGGADAAPAADLRDRVLSRLRATEIPSRGAGQARAPEARSAEPVRSIGSARTAVPRPPVFRWGALAAGLIAAVGLGFGLVQRREARGLRAQLAEAVQRLQQTSALLTQGEATLDAIMSPGVQMFQLTASGDPDPLVQVFWDRQRNQAIVHGLKLKPVPAGRAYQLWFIKDGAPVPSVTFKPESGGRVRVESIPVPADGDVSAAAITVEPEAGSAQPTSPILLVGPLKRS